MTFIVRIWKRLLAGRTAKCWRMALYGSCPIGHGCYLDRALDAADIAAGLGS